MQALKGVVILMTLAIAVLMTLIVYGMYQKSQDPDFKFFDLGGKNDTSPVMTDSTPSAPTANAPTAAPVRAFGDIHLNLPAGAAIASASVNGDRLVVIVATASGHNEVWVVELRTGAVLGRVLAQETSTKRTEP